MLQVRFHSNKKLREVGSYRGEIPCGSHYTFDYKGRPHTHTLYDNEGNRIYVIYILPINALGYYRKFSHNNNGGSLDETFDYKGKLLHRKEYDRAGRKHGLFIWTIKGKEVRENYYEDVPIEDPLYIEHPELITKELIFRTKNVDTRAVYVRLLGPERLLEKLEYEVLDIDVERNDILYRINLGDVKLNMVKFLCPSTGHVHFHFVPGSLETVDLAKCWMFGIEPQKFNPIKEA